MQHEILLDGLSIDEANINERLLINTHDTQAPMGYNLKSGGDNQTHSEETKQLISLHNARRGKSPAHKGRTDFHTQETKDLIARLSKQKSHSDETKELIRQIRLGTTHSEETKRLISLHSARRGKPAHNRGVPHSDEQRAKLRKAWETRPKRDPAPLVICPHCNKEGHKGNMMNRWHFDNCKYKS